MLIGDSGIIKKAQEAGKNYQNAAQYEDEELNHLLGEIENGSNKNDGSSGGSGDGTGDGDGSSGGNAGDAIESDILIGKTAYSGGKLLTGTMPNRGAVNETITAGQSYTIPEGYHNGNGTVTANGGGAKMIYIGDYTSNKRQSINITTKYADYQSLTNQNFILKVVDVRVAAYWDFQKDEYIDSPSGGNLAVSYNPSSGVVSINPHWRDVRWDDGGSRARYSFIAYQLYII